MSKRLMLLLALVFVAGMTCAAFAETQSVKVSGDLEFMSVFRDTMDLKGRDNWYHGDDASLSYRTRDTGKNDNIFLTFARLRVDADLTDNVTATIRLLSEMMWGKEDSHDDDDVFGPSDRLRDSDNKVYLDLAYATLKEFLYSPLTLVVGRQELHYGNDMIIGDGRGPTNRLDDRGSVPCDLSKRKSFDAVRAILNYDPLVVDVVYSKIRSTLEYEEAGRNATYERVGNRRDDDIDLYGVNAKYDFGNRVPMLKNTIVEGYYWYRRTGPRAYYPTGAGTVPNDYKSDQLHTFGGRVSTEPIENLTFQAEGALQRGRYNSDYGTTAGKHVADYNAYAVETAVTYTWKKSKYTPSATVLFAQFSGENNNWDSAATHQYRGWDPMFENQTFGHIANALLPQTNVRLIGLTGSMKPKDDVTAKLEYYNYWFVNPWGPDTTLTDYYGNAIGTKNDRHAGHEIDLTLTYDYTEDVQFNLLGGIFIPGGQFSRETSPTNTGSNNHAASEVIGSMKVTF
ncbi:MAG: hypothetical protein FJZ09_05390 [Candidatus Omnitrophica bacterium]|nr:hypothetical protein [Candidatus Omnitrophota bacterium]